MKKLKIRRLTILLASLITLGLPGTVFAKCYKFKNGGGYKACVRGDDLRARKKARKNCSKAKGSDCGSIGIALSTCHSNAGKCIDENGKLHRHLNGY